MKETKKQILIRLTKNTDLIKKEERKNKDSATRHLANLLNGTSGKKLVPGSMLACLLDEGFACLSVDRARWSTVLERLLAC